MRKASVTCSTFAPPPDVEKIGRLAAVQLDQVHRAHRQPRAVHQAADIAVQPHIAQAGLARLHLGRLLLRQIAERRQFRMPEQRIVVEAHLGVERHQLARPRHHQGIDFQQAAIAGDKRPAQRFHEFVGRLGSRGRKLQAGGELAHLEALQTRNRAGTAPCRSIRASWPPPLRYSCPLRSTPPAPARLPPDRQRCPDTTRGRCRTLLRPALGEPFAPRDRFAA